jgi:hypothetical protein
MQWRQAFVRSKIHKQNFYGCRQLWVLIWDFLPGSWKLPGLIPGLDLKCHGNITLQVDDSLQDTCVLFFSHRWSWRFTADKNASLHFSSLWFFSAKSFVKGKDELLLSGTTSDHEGVKGAVTYCARIKILTDNGTVTRWHGFTVTGAIQHPVFFHSDHFCQLQRSWRECSRKVSAYWIGFEP